MFVHDTRRLKSGIQRQIFRGNHPWEMWMEDTTVCHQQLHTKELTMSEMNPMLDLYVHISIIKECHWLRHTLLSWTFTWKMQVNRLNEGNENTKIVHQWLSKKVPTRQKSFYMTIFYQDTGINKGKRYQWISSRTQDRSLCKLCRSYEEN